MIGKSLDEIIDFDRYPLNNKNELDPIIKKAHQEFATNGVSILDGFIRPDSLKEMISQSLEIADQAFHNKLTGNAYLTETNPELAANHPVNMTEETRLGAIAYDQIPQQHLIRQVYESDQVLEFIAAISQLGPVHRYACPLGGLNIAAMEEDEYLRWHFDQSEFVVSIPLQEAISGGKFEYAHNIRSHKDENYPSVRDLLLGDRQQVRVLDAAPGSLVLFQGMNTIHRVTRIEGKQLRLGALLGYANKPDVQSSDYLKKIRYGRTTSLSH